PHGRRDLSGNRLNVLTLECAAGKLQIGHDNAHWHVWSHDLHDVIRRAPLHEAEDRSEGDSTRLSNTGRGICREPDLHCAGSADDKRHRLDAVRSDDSLRNELHDVDASVRDRETENEIGLQKLGVGIRNAQCESNDENRETPVEHTCLPYATDFYVD